MKALANALNNNLTISTLWLQNIKMSNNGKKILTTILKNNTTLLKLFLTTKKESRYLKWLQVINNNGIGIRKTAAYPGNRIRKKVKHGEVVAFDEVREYTYQNHNILFYHLLDNSGWIHNFNSKTNTLNGIRGIYLSRNNFIY